METTLLEWSSKNTVLRGIMCTPEHPSFEGVLLLSGFQRAATTAPKMKLFADRLGEVGIPSFRFDYTGYGISDGSAEDTTLTRMISDAESACVLFRQQGIKMIHIFAHSIGGAVTASMFQKDPSLFGKIVLLAPGLNMKDLIRFQIMRYIKKGKEYVPSWADTLRTPDTIRGALQFMGDGIQLRDGYIKKQFFLELLTQDVTHAFDGFEDRILHVYGDHDDLIPIESIPKVFPHTILVSGGDHELEEKKMKDQWFESCIHFLMP